MVSPTMSSLKGGLSHPACGLKEYIMWVFSEKWFCTWFLGELSSLLKGKTVSLKTQALVFIWSFLPCHVLGVSVWKGLSSSAASSQLTFSGGTSHL